MRDTPRTDEVWEKFETDLRGKFDDAEFYTLARKLERELNAANARIKRLEREVEVLRLYGNNECTAMADQALKEGRL